MTNPTEATAHDELWRTLQIVSDWIKVADAKAGAALAVDGAVLALTASKLRGEPSPELPAIFALSTAVALASASVLFAIWTVLPQARRLRTNSITHYGTIAAFTSSSDYHVAVLETLINHDELTKNLTGHIWAFSLAATRKYVLVTWAIKLLASGILAGVLGLLLP